MLNKLSFSENFHRYQWCDMPEYTPFFEGTYQPNPLERAGETLFKPYRAVSAQQVTHPPLSGLIRKIGQIILIPLALLGAYLKQQGEQGKKRNPGFSVWSEFKQEKTKIFNSSEKDFIGNHMPISINRLPGTGIDYIDFKDDNNPRQILNSVSKDVKDMNESTGRVFTLFRKVESSIPDEKEMANIVDQVTKEAKKYETPKLEAKKNVFDIYLDHLKKVQEGIKPLYQYKADMVKAYQKTK